MSHSNVSMRPHPTSKLLKVVILGNGGIGKTCLMNRFVSDQYDENSFHTIGVEFLKKDLVVDGSKYTLQIWDTAGQERFKALRTPFYRGSDICLLTYAIDDRMSFRGLMKWHEEFLKYADVGESSFPFIVVGNKSDLGKTERRQVTAEEVAAWCKEYKIASFIETSAKQAVNITEAFSEAVRQWRVLDRIASNELRSGDTIDLMQRPITIGASGKQGSSCCGGGGGGGGSNTASPSHRRNLLDTGENL